MQDLTPGQSIAQRFTLTRRLAWQGPAESWLAQDSERQQPAVLSIFPDVAPAAVNEEVRAELARVGNIVHPHLARFLGSFDQADCAVLAHDFVAGGDLYALSGHDYREVLRVLMPLMDVLAYLHDLGLAHGALDEDAIHIDADNNVWLGRLGVAWIKAGPADARTDIGALGAMLERLTGATGGMPLPETIGSLLAGMQSGRGGVRNMHEVRRRIARALDIEDHAATSASPLEGAASGSVQPVGRSGAAPAAPAKPVIARQSVPFAVAVPALLIMLAAAVFVMFFLRGPDAVQAPVLQAASPAQSGPAAATTPVPNASAAPFAAAASARLRQDAQDTVMTLLRSLVALEERGVEQWAPEDFARARAAGDDGDALYRDQQFAAALTRYREGVELAESLVARSGEVLQTALAAGEAALAGGASDEARRQFEMALVIDASNPQASEGVERAGKLESVLAKMAAGAEQEQAGQLLAARDNYRQALAIDAQYSAATESLQRVQAKLAGQQFQQLMSRGFRDLDNGNMEAARSAFQQAAKLRPNAAGPRDALAQVAMQLRDSDIATRRAVAETAERNENWQAAADAYRSIVQTDNTLVFARDGLRRAEQRAQLAARMQMFIDEPLRMFGNEAYNEARSILAQARQIPGPGPVLQRQITGLASEIAVARTPVTVQLRSDGLTRVVILKIGEIGRFQQQAVGLIPGRYTAVGSRVGYRDVRREFEVRAGEPPPPVSIICEDPV